MQSLIDENTRRTKRSNKYNKAQLRFGSDNSNAGSKNRSSFVRENSREFSSTDFCDDLLFDEVAPRAPLKRNEKSSRRKGDEDERAEDFKEDDDREYENEKMKEILKMRRLTRPETKLELDILNKIIIDDVVVVVEQNHSPPRSYTSNSSSLLLSNEEQQLKKQCEKIKRKIEDSGIIIDQRKDCCALAHVATSSKYRGACALRNLVHSYVWIDPERKQQQQQKELTSLEMNLRRIIVEPDLRSHFVIAYPTKEYLKLLNELPLKFVGTFQRLLEIIDFMAVKMNSSFLNQSMDTPPWRRAKSIASKWSMPISDVSSSSSSFPASHNANTTTNSFSWSESPQTVFHRAERKATTKSKTTS